MTNNKSSEFCDRRQELAEYGRLLSHPARIAIIELLAKEKEIMTGNISDLLPLKRTTVSQHLKELRNAGIILGNIDGLKVHYCLNMTKLKEIQTKLNKLFEDSISNYVCTCDCDC